VAWIYWPLGGLDMQATRTPLSRAKWPGYPGHSGPDIRATPLLL